VAGQEYVTVSLTRTDFSGTSLLHITGDRSVERHRLRHATFRLTDFYPSFFCYNDSPVRFAVGWTDVRNV